jgi:recombination protein RecR
MSFSEYPSKLLENAVNEFASLPGIGRKTAFRLVMHLLKRDSGEVKKFGDSILRLHKEIRYCTICHSISDNEVCTICSDDKRDKSLICVVENIQDVMAIDNTRQYKGVYHVLGGVISPVDGIGPSDLKIDTLE